MIPLGLMTVLSRSFRSGILSLASEFVCFLEEI